MGKTDEQILDDIAKILREILNTPVEYGYDAVTDRYFFNVPAVFGAYIDFVGSALRDRRWDILYRMMERLEAAVNKEKGEEDE